MSELGKFIAFQAAVALIKERGYQGLLSEVAQNCKDALKEPRSTLVNHVKKSVREFFLKRFLQKLLS